MQPGLSRAIPMAIIGFMFGALVVIVIRGLQGLDPIWDAGPGIILSAITMAMFFVWGMGAFDPRLSIHGDHEVEEAVHEQLAEEAAQPRSLLFGATWQIATIVLLLIIVLGGFAALPGGLALTQTTVPGASPTTVGYTPVSLPFGGPEIQVSTLVIFAIFIIWAFVSLAVAAGAIGYIFVFLARGVAEVKVAGAAAGGGTAALPAPEAAPEPAVHRSSREALITFFGVIVSFVGLFVLLNLAIGLIIPGLSIPGVALMLDTPTQIQAVALIIAIVLTYAIWGRARFMYVAPFVVWFYVLYLVFYFVAIGLILPQPSLPGLNLFLTPLETLAFLSATNAALFALIILRLPLVLAVIGIVARWVAFQLRRLPHILQ